jgi:broad specificity phosphatase PhoE
MSHILLARHGQSVSNAIRRFQGSQDVELSDLGARQAEALARVVRSRPVVAIYTSPLARARRTAEIAAAGTNVPVTSVDDLRELCLGEWEGRTVEEIRSLPDDPYARWVRDPVACLPPGGEPLSDVQDRVVRSMGQIARAHPNGGQVLVVCHGGVISAYLAHCLGLPLSSIWRLTVSNGSLSEVRPPRVHSVNNTRHLDGVAVRGAAEGEPRAESNDSALGYPTPTPRAP